MDTGTTHVQRSPPKQRRGSLPASPALTPITGWTFRDEMGLPTGNVPKGYFLHERSQSTGIPSSSMSADEPGLKRTRKKWTQDETQMLVDGCNSHGVGNWKAILNDPALKFEVGRTAVDLKDRFRTYFPDAYRQHYPNAKTHLSDKIRSALPNGGSLFEKTRTKRRRPFSSEEDDALRRGYEKHGTLWAQIAQDPVFQAQQRRSTDLRDRFRNAFPDLYEAAGYKPRTPSKKVAAAPHSVRSMDTATKQQDHARSRTLRRRLTYPGMVHGGSATPASDSVDYSSADEDPNASAMDALGASPASTSHLRRNPSMRRATSDPHYQDAEAAPSTLSRRMSPYPDQDSMSLSSQSHFLSGPASPSSPGHAFADSASRDGDARKAAWSGADWLGQDAQSLSHIPLTASSLFSANMFGSLTSGHHDVLDRYDLYSSPLSSSANTFGDYVSDLGIGGSFSEADMDLNAFAGPASSMGFTHHSHVAGDLIFASHHGGHLHLGHGFGLYDTTRPPYMGDAPSQQPLPQPPDSSLGLSNVSFSQDPSACDPHGPFDPHSLDSLLTAEDASLALFSQASHDMTPMSDVFNPNLTVSPAELSAIPSHLSNNSSTPSAASIHPALSPRPPVLPFAPVEARMSPIPVPSQSPAAVRRLPVQSLRSASQPPGEYRSLDMRRLPVPASVGLHAPPTSTRDDSMQDVGHRTADTYQLPFLDLHYYGVSEGHPSSSHFRDVP